MGWPIGRGSSDGDAAQPEVTEEPLQLQGEISRVFLLVVPCRMTLAVLPVWG